MATKGSALSRASSRMEGSTLVGAKLGDEGRRAGGEGVHVVEKLANHHYGGRWRVVERPDHDERCRRRVPYLHTYHKKLEEVERWSSGDHRLGLDSSGGGRRKEIRRRRARCVAWGS
jgi:hypothetical protein